MKKVLILSILYYVLLIGCIKGRCDNVRDGLLKFKNVIAANCVAIIDSNNYFYSKTNFENDTIVHDAYVLYLNFESERIVQNNVYNPFVNSAYALSCPEPSYLSTQLIDKVKIETVNKLNDTYEAGSDVTDLFWYAETKEVGTPNAWIDYQSIPDFIQAYHNNYKTSVSPEFFYLGNFVLKSGVITGWHQFNITIALKDQTIFTTTTTSVYLK